MTKTIFLHIGTYKTATSFLQDVFYFNYRKPGKTYYYPRTGLDGNAHHYLAAPNYPAWKKSVGIEVFKKRWHDLASEVSNVDSKFYIISSEMFCDANEETIFFIKDILKEYNLKAILYLRRQDQYVSSLAAQIIKGCHGVKDHYTNLERAIQVSLDNRCNYAKICTQWSEVLGNDNLIVRPYEKGQLYNSDILLDFYFSLFREIPPKSLQIPTKSSNPRLCRDALEFKMHINKLPVGRDIIESTLPHLLNFSHSVDPNTCKSYQEHKILTFSKTQEILNKFSDTNSFVANTFLGRNDGQLFKTEFFDNNKEWLPYSGLTEDSLEKIVTYLYKSVPNTLSIFLKNYDYDVHKDKNLDIIMQEINRQSFSFKMNYSNKFFQYIFEQAKCWKQKLLN